MHDDVHAGPGFDPAPVPDPGGALPRGVFAPALQRIEPWLPTRAARGWFALFALLTLVHLVAQLVVPGGRDVAQVTQWLLMPPLAAALWTATAPPRPRLVQLAVVALLCSWAGDTVPSLVPDDSSFSAMMGVFLCAQVVYVAAFWPSRERSVLRRARGVVVLYAVFYLAVVVGASQGLAPGSPGAVMVVGLVVYGAALVTMALLATGVDRLAAIGGLAFLVSDGLIGLAQGLPETVDALPPGGHAFLVMLTYVAAQTLLAAGVLRCSAGGRRVGGHG